MCPDPIRQRGFTLIEAIMVITITGVLSAMVAVFLRGAVDSYFNTARRAELTDVADTALRRMGRDLRLAIPNSVRVTTVGGVRYLELLLAKTGGRYVHQEACFTATCASLTSMGSVLETIGGVPGVPAGPNGGRYLMDTVTAADRIVVFNLYNNAGNDCAADNPSAYCGQNATLITGAVDAGGSDVFSFAPFRFVPLDGSPTRRFQIMAGPVTYACNPAARTLVRHAGYAPAAVQPTPPAVAPDLLANNVNGCDFAYAQGVFERWGVASLRLELSDPQLGESVNLYHEVHINNTP